MGRARRKQLSICALLAALLIISILDHAGAFGYRGDDRVRYDGVSCTVTRVVNGDTLDVDLPDGNHPTTQVRLRGIDAPNIAQAPGEKDSFFGPQAKDSLRKEVEGRRITIRLDPIRRPRDKFGRLLAFVHLGGELQSVNERMIETGCAYADGRLDHVFKLQFAQREKASEKGRIGLWAGVTPEQMPKWKKRMIAYSGS